MAPHARSTTAARRPTVRGDRIEISKAGLRRRVAVLDSVPCSSEHARRAIRGLGHTPLMFSDVAELQGLGGRCRELAMVFVGCPTDDVALDTLVGNVRSLVGSQVPMMFAVHADQLRIAISHCRAIDDVVVTPSSFGKLYQSFERFMCHHSLPVLASGFELGRYRFLPAAGTVQMDGHSVELQPLDFDLALELFLNAGRTLSRDWLRSMTIGCEANRASRWIDHSVSRVRRALDLSSEQGWSLTAIPWKGYRLSTPAQAAAEEVRE